MLSTSLWIYSHIPVISYPSPCIHSFPLYSRRHAAILAHSGHITEGKSRTSGLPARLRGSSSPLGIQFGGGTGGIFGRPVQITLQSSASYAPTTTTHRTANNLPSHMVHTHDPIPLCLNYYTSHTHNPPHNSIPLFYT